MSETKKVNNAGESNSNETKGKIPVTLDGSIPEMESKTIEFGHSDTDFTSDKRVEVEAKSSATPDKKVEAEAEPIILPAPEKKPEPKPEPKEVEKKEEKPEVMNVAKPEPVVETKSEKMEESKPNKTTVAFFVGIVIGGIITSIFL